MTDPSASLADEQNQLLRAYASELVRINQQINLISAATEDEIWKRHVRHCLTLTQRDFPDGSVVVDWGSGGGLPALPLAIACPHITVHAVDSVRKKMQAVRMMARQLEVENLHTHHARAEAWEGGPVHYSVSRATAPLVDLWRWHLRVATPWPNVPDSAWAPGLLTLKGGHLAEEIAELKAAFPDVVSTSHPLWPSLGGTYFEEKVLIHVTASA
ncbi:MAG: 16S rRNA (guanine(527)-N(7))-methyltransferase RsmG [Bacteroidetes bacterium]|jgi:16S rRNA (guanine527-N7)-methyltransferase|nr:16S rRNA (guanine(527)-N(7))-methyltransferase RsmG [Bacteroidota bacterium]